LPRVTGYVRIEAGRLFDPSEGLVVHDAAVLMWNGRIVAVGPASAIPVPEGTSTISFPAHSLLPGLIDAHCHLNLPGDGSTFERFPERLTTALLETTSANARRALASGVTTLRDTGGARRTSLAVRDAIDAGQSLGPKVYACGAPITRPRGHTWPFGGGAGGIPAIRRMIEQQAAKGADFIKIVGSGGGTTGTNAYVPSYGLEELRAAVVHAHSLGLRTVVHATCTKAIKNALQAGADMITHCDFYEADGTYRFSYDVAKEIAARGVWVNPTIHVMRTLIWHLESLRKTRVLSQTERDELKQRQNEYADSLRNLQELMAVGVRLAAGSDSGWRWYAFGGFYHELEALVEAGLSPWAALRAGTSDGALAIGAWDVGSLRPGSVGDILVIAGDPVEDISAIAKVEAVYLAGGRVGSGQRSAGASIAIEGRRP
jgi:imidazolonepropionase-like amidohydrolase